MISVGDDVIDPASGQTAKVARIATMGQDFETAGAGQAVALVLDRDIDVSRGAVLAKPDSAPKAARTIDVRMVWLSDQPYDSDAAYLLRSATDLVPAGLDIQAHLDLDTLGQVPATGCAVNDIAVARINLGRSTALDTFAVLAGTGVFVLVDAVSGATVAGGVVTRISSETQTGTAPAFALTREILAAGLCQGLGSSAADVTEFQRRWVQAERLLGLAGVKIRSER
jgi:bifunctional enzyme CysN/CysC